jgi:hypothetical protein
MHWSNEQSAAKAATNCSQLKSILESLEAILEKSGHVSRMPHHTVSAFDSTEQFGDMERSNRAQATSDKK